MVDGDAAPSLEPGSGYDRSVTEAALLLPNAWRPLIEIQDHIGHIVGVNLLWSSKPLARL
jgi:hypothetical protein